MITKLKRVVDSFLKSDKQFPVITAIASGLYPMLYCYSKNFSIVNSLDHFLFFIVAFLCIPIVVFKLVHWVSKFNSLKKYDKYILPFFNIFTFLFLIKTIAYAGFDKKKTLLVILISIIFAVFFNKYLKKIVVFQYLLAFVSAISLTFIISKNLRISNEWQVQPDDIVKVEFKIKPNIYFIQPDGYVNFSEIKK